MKKFFNSMILVLAVVAAALGFSASAAETAQEPIITIKTNMYAENGASNSFTLLFGGTKGEYIDVDCGYGTTEYELQEATFDSESGGIAALSVTCNVSEAGVVKIYGKAEAIDYFNADGCCITEIDLSKLVNLDILSLNHNELKGLDLTPNTKLRALYLSDNEFTAETPLKVGGNKPNMTIMDLSIIKHIDQSFNLSDYPELASFDGYHNTDIYKADVTGCPKLQRLSLDLTNVSTVDVTKCPNLMILNVSDTRVTKLDVSKNPYLIQLYCGHDGSVNNEYKISELDLTHNPELSALFAQNNNLTTLDVSKNTKLVDLYLTTNKLTSLDLSNNASLVNVLVSNNDMDFATLPFDPGTWTQYDYQQNAMPVKSSYALNSSIDLSNRVLREGTDTYFTLYSVTDDDPLNPTALDESYYSFENGKIKFNKISADSLYLAFTNSAFPNTVLTTTKFMVKTAENMGKPNLEVNFGTIVSTGQNVAMSVAIAGASAATPKEVYVDFGNGETQKLTVTNSAYPAAPNVIGTRTGNDNVKLYVNDDDHITAFGLNGVYVTNIDLSSATLLKDLRLTNTELYTINLVKNKELMNLDLSHNNMRDIDMSGYNGTFGKNKLNSINLSYNQLSNVTFSDVLTVHNLDVSHNNLETMDFSNADNVVDLNLSYNKFTSLSFKHSSVLKSLNISHNALSELIMPDESVIENLNLADNKFTLANLPEKGNMVNYEYAPQADFVIATKGPCTDLSEMNRVIDGVGTVFTWKDTSGKTLVEGTDYTNDNGFARFLNTNVGKIYCEMTNAAFPAFAGKNVYKTTQIEAAGKPSNLVATFNTVNAGDEVTLSLASNKEGVAVYFDWNGDGNVTQYVLGATYRVFNAKTRGAKTVNVYTYEPTDVVRVFSMSGAKLSSFDGSKLTKATTITINDAELTDIKLPADGVIRELTLTGNKFTAFDLAPYKDLVMVNLNENELTSIDLSNNKELQVASIAFNNLTSAKFDNKNLWGLYLNENNFSEITLDGVPNVEQISLAHNNLNRLNVDNLKHLVGLAINNNKFTFSTLPPVKPSYVVYQYYEQAALDVAPVAGKVDLSSQATVNGTPTVYGWYVGTPVVNEEGEIEGENLIEGEEYTVENGITTFLKTNDGIMCVMTNSQFPSLYLCTSFIDVKEVGVDGIYNDAEGVVIGVENHNINIKAEAGLDIKLFAVSGTQVYAGKTVEDETQISDVATGAYVLTVGNKAYKLVVK